MDSRPLRIAPAWPLLAGWLACAISGAGGAVRAQAPAGATSPGQGRPTGPTEGRRPDARSGPGAKPAGGQDRDRPKAEEPAPANEKARAQPPRREPSAEYQESIRKTIEQRRRRRARRAQAQGPDDPRPVGAIVPWPLPPALIIRQTPQVHGEVDSLLGGLRRAR